MAGRPGGHIPVGARFSAPLQTGLEAHLTSYIIGTGSFTGVKRPGRGVGYPSHLSSRLKERLVIFLLPLWAFVACSWANFAFYLHCVSVAEDLMHGCNPIWA